MATSSSLVQAMNDISLEDEEEGGLSLELETNAEAEEGTFGFDAKLCIVGKFLTEGRVDFQALQQTLAAL